MAPGRILLIGVGLLIAVGAIVLVVQGFSGAVDPKGPPTATAPAGGDKEKEKEKDKEKSVPHWQSFVRPGERTAAAPRPVVSFAARVASPFGRVPPPPAPPPASLTGRVGPAAGPARPEGPARPAAPSLRLEGLSIGASGASGPALALISGKVVRVGESVNGFRLLRIDPSSVSLAGPKGDRLDLVLGASPAPAPARPPGGGGR